MQTITTIGLDIAKSGYEQVAQIPITLFADATESVLAPARMLLRPSTHGT